MSLNISGREEKKVSVGFQPFSKSVKKKNKTPIGYRFNARFFRSGFEDQKINSVYLLMCNAIRRRSYCLTLHDATGTLVNSARRVNIIVGKVYV